MKIYFFIVGLLLSENLFAECEVYWELYENYASSSAIKYHDILQSIEAGNIDEAKEKLLIYQAAEVLVLEELQKQKGISDKSMLAIGLIRKYNTRHVE